MAKKVVLPKDGNGIAAQLTPAVKPLKVTYNAAISSTLDITLQAGTTLIEVSALAKAVLLRWGASAAVASTDNFSEIIQAGETRQFFVPIDTTTGNLFAHINLIEQAASATVVVVEK